MIGEEAKLGTGGKILLEPRVLLLGVSATFDPVSEEAPSFLVSDSSLFEEEEKEVGLVKEVFGVDFEGRDGVEDEAGLEEEVEEVGASFWTLGEDEVISFSFPFPLFEV